MQGKDTMYDVLVYMITYYEQALATTTNVVARKVIMDKIKAWEQAIAFYKFYMERK